MTYSSVPKFDIEMAQIGFCDVENSFPGVEALGYEHLGVLGKTQSRQAFLQLAAHVEGRRRVLSGWCRGDGGGAVVMVVMGGIDKTGER